MSSGKDDVQRVEYSFTNDEKTYSATFLEKAQKQPFLIASIVAFTTICGVGAYRWKRRTTKDPALFLVQLRVAAQGTAVGLLGAGMIYQMLNEFVFDKNNKALADKKD